MMRPPAARPRPPASLIIAGALIFILAVVTIVGALTAFQLPDPITAQAKDTDLLYQPVLAISFVIFFLVTAGIIWACFRYRRRGPELPEQIHGSSTLEFTWTVIPIIILVALFIPSLILLIDLKSPPDAEDADVVVDVVAHQWWWEFDYGQGLRVQATPPNYEDLEPPRLVVPVDSVILLRLRSTDVIHSFSAPQTLYKMHVVPGNVNEMHFTTEDVGVYRGQCYQFCGLRHSDMRFILEVKTKADYEKWLTDTRRAQGLSPEPEPKSGARIYDRDGNLVYEAAGDQSSGR